jgi:hypothetical protein
LVELKTGAAVTASTSIAINPATGSKSMTVVSAILDDPNSVFYYISAGVPADGDQVRYTGANTTIAPSGLMSQTVEETIDAQHWDLGTTSYGPTATFGILGSGDIGNVIGPIMDSVIIQSIIS